VSETLRDHDSLVLQDGAKIAVVGGGPTGSFFSIFALKMAQLIGKKLDLTIFENKDFSRNGPAGCNRCGGIISELLVQTLAVEGIILPDEVVQRGINSYRLHTSHGSVFIATPGAEKTIATVYRGGGPQGTGGSEKMSFDNFLLSLAMKEGAAHQRLKIDRIESKNGKPVLFSQDHEIQDADLVVGAVGVKGSSTKIFEDMGFGYRTPSTVTAAIAEISMDPGIISEHFANCVQLFLLPIKDIKFAAIIPKSTYLTVCILGKNMNPQVIDNFLDHPVVKSIFPGKQQFQVDCRCLPKMNVAAPRISFTDRVVMCGDAGSTRLLKDGLNAAYIMGKAAAKTAVFEGVSKQNFRDYYYPVYKNIINDNLYGKYLYFIMDFYKKIGVMSKAMLEVVEQEQKSSTSRKTLSSILWDLFTGNERYKKIFPEVFDLKMQIGLWSKMAKVIIRRT
jgi:flavin-dependent dehydrogenase